MYLMYLLVLTERIMQQGCVSMAGALGEGFMWGISSYCRQIMKELVAMLCSSLNGNSQVEGDSFRKSSK